jgi:hypothetical protein
MRVLLAILVVAGACAPAFAAGGLNCSADDKKVKLEVNSGVTHGMGGPTFNFTASVEIRSKAVSAALRELTFDESNRPQYGLDGRELRLLLYKEREDEAPFGSVEVEIRTRAAGDPDEGTYKGNYKITVYDMEGRTTGEGKQSTFSGAVSCFAE